MGNCMARFRLSPSLDELQLYALICSYLVSEEASFREIADKFDPPLAVSALTACVARLEKKYKVTLINRSKGSGKSLVTKEGRKLWEQARKLITDHAKLQVWAQENEETTEELVVDMADVIMQYYFPGAWITRYLESQRTRWKKKISLRFHNSHTTDNKGIVRKMRAGEVQIGVGTAHKDAEKEFPDISIEPLTDANKKPLYLDRVFICPPGHPWVEEFQRGTRKTVSDHEFDTQVVCHLPPGFDPGIEKLPPPNREKGGDRIMVNTVGAVVALVRSGVCVGFVAGMYGFLDELRKLNLIFYWPLGPMKDPLALYLPRHWEKTFSEAAVNFVEAIQDHFRGAITKPGWPQDSQPRLLPRDKRFYKRLQAAFYVSCDRGGSTAPQFYRGKLLEWEVTERETSLAGNEERVLHFTGKLKDFDSPAGRGDGYVLYDLEGERLGDDVLYLKGVGLGRNADRFVAAFNTVSDDGNNLIGVWTGTDGRGGDSGGWPTSGVIILSSQETLTVMQLREMTRRAGLYFLPTAEGGLGE